MNDEARELLVAAALNGHRQVHGQLHGSDGGECALGVLHLAMHATRDEALACFASEAAEIHCAPRTAERFVLWMDWQDLVEANDIHRWDFLTIARKVGAEEPRDP